jgi:hypothetical protein
MQNFLLVFFSVLQLDYFSLDARFLRTECSTRCGQMRRARLTVQSTAWCSRESGPSDRVLATSEPENKDLWATSVRLISLELQTIETVVPQCCGSGSGALLPPGSGMNFIWIPDPAPLFGETFLHNLQNPCYFIFMKLGYS